MGVRIPPAARCVCARVAKPAVVVPPMHGKARGEIISFGVRYHLSVPSLRYRYIPALGTGTAMCSLPLYPPVCRHSPNRVLGRRGL